MPFLKPHLETQHRLGAQGTSAALSGVAQKALWKQVSHDEKAKLQPDKAVPVGFSQTLGSECSP